MYLVLNEQYSAGRPPGQKRKSSGWGPASKVSYSMSGFSRSPPMYQLSMLQTDFIGPGGLQNDNMSQINLNSFYLLP